MRVVRVAIVSAALLTIASRASAGDPAAARDQLKLGYNLAQQGKCDEALPHLSESLRLEVKAITLINLASCEEKVGHLTDALGHWVDARARARAEGDTGIESEAEKRQAALEPRLAHLTIAVAKGTPPDAEISRDGVVLGGASLGVSTSVNPGSHTIVVKAPGRKDAKFDVLVVEADTKQIEVSSGAIDPNAKAPGAAVTPAPVEQPSRGTSPLVYIGFGVGAAGLAVGAVTGLMALSKASSAKSACPNLGCASQSDLDSVDSGRTLGTVSTIGFIVAGVGAAVGVYGLVWAAPAKTTVAFDASGVRGTF